MVQSEAADAGWLAQRIGGVRPADIHRGIAALIDARVLDAGQQMPTVRDVAAELGISVGTVSTAWAQLRRDGLLITRRRGGTTVAAPRSSRIGVELDLSAASADPALLPDLSRSVEELIRRGRSDGAPAITAELRRAAARRWPYRPPALIAVQGVRAALHLITSALVDPGAPIAAVDPLCRRTADVLRRLGRPILPVVEDEHGPLPDSLARAFAAGARLFCFEPTNAVPAGSSVSEPRALELADVVRRTEQGTYVFEESTTAGFSEGLSLGGRLPDQVLHAATYARAFGGDLAVALLSGPADAIGRLAELQADQGALAGILDQHVLAHLLGDRATARRTRSAADVYRIRNSRLRHALRDRGVAAQGNEFFLWIPVLDEPEAVESLARRGVRASPGAQSTLVADVGPHLRLGTTRLPDGSKEIELLADLITEAAALRQHSPGASRAAAPHKVEG